ncbi:unnamed protein product [Brassica rapa subsp. trilocularis]
MAFNLVLCLFVYLLFTQGAEGSIDNFSLIVCFQDFDCVEIYKQPAFQHPLLKITRFRKYSVRMRILKEATTMKRKSNVQRERFQYLDNEMDPRAFI